MFLKDLDQHPYFVYRNLDVWYLELPYLNIYTSQHLAGGNVKLYTIGLFQKEIVSILL